MPTADSFLTDTEKELVVKTIREAERKTSGEIRVHLEDHTDMSAYDRAVQVFYRLGMDKTQFKNGVLLYIAVKDRKFAVISDEGLNQKLNKDFWDKEIAHMGQMFSRGEKCQGIVDIVEDIAKVLATHFPPLDDLNKNELPDDLSFQVD